MITQQEINETCECLLTEYTYAPYIDPISTDQPLNVFPEDLEFIWKFISCTREDICGKIPIQPKAVEPGNIMLYDCGTASWVELNPAYITSVRHPLADSCCETMTSSFPSVGWDSQAEEFVNFGENISQSIVNYGDLIEHGVEHVEHFDCEKYLQDIKTHVDAIEVDEDKDPWSVNFGTYSYIIDWVGLFEELNFSEEELAKNTLDMGSCNKRWKLLIQQKAEAAKVFLQEQKDTLTEENASGIRQELIDENNEEIQELDAISELISTEISDYQTACDDCKDIRELVSIWPPILMPMPYKRELVKVSALSAHDVNDPVDI